MPIKIADALPAYSTLMQENIFVMSEDRAEHQDIRPLHIAIVNLMPTKVETETQLLRLLGNTPLQVEITLVHTATYISKNISQEHLSHFYKTFEQIKHEKFDGMIITGAPIEQMAFEDVDYWAELREIMAWSVTNVYSTLHICWGAQAGLYFHYGIPKHLRKEKLSGIYRHRVLIPTHPLLRGFDDWFYVPHSRYTEVLKADIEKVSGLDILTCSDVAGIHIVADRDCRKFFVTGHSEYDRGTLAAEYARDVGKGLPTKVPDNYFPSGNPDEIPVMLWKAHASLLFSNWLNFIVYQHTPYNLSEIR